MSLVCAKSMSSSIVTLSISPGLILCTTFTASIRICTIIWGKVSHFPFAKYRLRTGFAKFWKVIKVDNSILQDLESFGEREVFQNGHEKVVDFCLGNF